ncbi:MAG: chromate efflux transporter [Phycisphaerales bacterium]
MVSPLRIFGIFLLLGCTSFGGPIAHLGYFRRAFVERRRWLTEAEYADLVGMCQFLPGPSSSQTGFAIGLHAGGLAGGVAAFLGFTLPSAALMAALGAGAAGAVVGGGWLLGLKALAVAVVIHALHAMARALTPTPLRAAIALVVAGLLVALSRGGFATAVNAFAQPVAIAAGALVGCWALRERADDGAGGGTRAPGADARAPDDAAARSIAFHLPRALGALALLALLGGLALTIFAPAAGPIARAGAACFQSGALVFGGGHVVLPLLAAPFVEHGWTNADTMLAAYSLAQAVPGPLFSMTAYLGAAMARGEGALHVALAAALLQVAVFLPGLLLVLAVLPLWHRLRAQPGVRAASAGANAAVVGVLGAALADAVMPAGIYDLRSLAVAAACLLLLCAPRMPVVFVVAFGAVAGWALLG